MSWNIISFFFCSIYIQEKKIFFSSQATGIQVMGPDLPHGSQFPKYCCNCMVFPYFRANLLFRTILEPSMPKEDAAMVSLEHLSNSTCFSVFNDFCSLSSEPGSELFLWRGAQSCPTLHKPMDLEPARLFCLRNSPARILEWVAISFSGASSQPGAWTHVSCTGRQILYHWATREDL